MRLYGTPAGQIVASLLDWSRTAWVYRPDVANLVMSFWGCFGWGTPALPSGWLYLFGPLTVLALAGVAVGLARGHTSWLRQVGTMLGLALIVGWGSAVLRVHPVFVLKHLFWPGARYACVVIAPTALLLCAGLATILPRRWLRWEAYAGLVGMIVLEVVALCTVIVPYYYG
jgi:hypothetical protein